MRRLSDLVVSFVKKEDGPTAVEYAVMLSLIIVVCLVAITTLGSQANNTFSTTGNKLRAAKELGISRCYLHRLLNQLDIPGVKPEDDSEENEPRRPSGVRAGSEDLRMGARAV